MFPLSFHPYPFILPSFKPLQQQTAQIKMEQPESIQQKKRTQNPQSLFHNYQKHLLVTLKQIIDHSKLNNQVAQEMWIIFLCCKTYSTRSYYEILFGNKYVSGINQSLFIKFQFDKILSKYSHEQILQAQQTLKEKVLECFDNKSMEELMKFRRLNDKKKDNLKIFINEFLQQLREGKFQRRIPKNKKKEIQSIWNMNLAEK